MRTPMPGAVPTAAFGTGTVAITGELTAAIEHGRICALAADTQRDLQACGHDYAALFPGNPFDPRLFSTVALANAFGSPWETPDRIRIAARSSLWVFAADWAVDYLARSPADLADLVRHCTTAGTGAAEAVSGPEDDGPPGADRPEPGDAPTGEQAPVHAELARFLTDIRAELTGSPLFPALEPLWRDQLERYLAAMTREWEWKAAAARGRAAGTHDDAGPDRRSEPGSGSLPDAGSGLPSFPEYLGNADNFGSSLVNLSHWIATGDGNTVRHIEPLHTASRQVQQVLRLLNDLVSFQRDVEWGDLNGLMLGVGREEVERHIAVLVTGCRDLIGPLKREVPREAAYLERQIGYSTGFYGVTDYWGAL